MNSISDNNCLEAGRTIPFHSCYRAKCENSLIKDVLDIGHFRAEGKYFCAAENELKRLSHAQSLYLTNSCTSAMEIAALVSGVEPGDEVIVPSFTFCATATAFARTGASIVLCDVSPTSMMMDINDVSRKITKRTKVIVPVHYGGYSVDMNHLAELNRDGKILIVEDAAQGLGSTRGGEALGTIGHMGAYSFHETKIAHCGHGGALLVNTADPNINRRVDETIQRGTNYSECKAGKTAYYEWTRTGASFQPTELDAALLLSQLRELDIIIDKRRQIDKLYRELLSEINVPILSPDAQTYHNGHAIVLVMGSDEQAIQLINYARQVGIVFQSHYKPLHLSRYGRKLGYKPEDMPNALRVWNRLVRLPIHTEMKLGDVHRVADFVNSFVNPIRLACA